MSETAPLKVMIAAGEVSGDMYGGALIRALREQYPDRALDVRGMGGNAMEAEGAKLLHHTDALGAMGIFEVLKKLSYFKRVMKEMVALAETWKPDVLITLDYYSFNIALAEKVKALGVRTVHYISPKVWVWRSGRIHRMAKAYDLLLCIFPFEPALYEPVGLKAVYVGHPLVEQAEITKAEAAPSLPWDGDNKIALLPGSRMGEIHSILPTFLKAAREIEKAKEGNCSFIIPVPTPKLRLEVERMLLKYPCPHHLSVVDGNARHVMLQAKAAMIASGTATLEACLMNCPTVLAYRVSMITECIAHLVLPKASFQFAGLVNIIAGKCVMTELLQRNFTAQNTAQKVLEYLDDTPERQAMLTAYADVRGKLGAPGATERTAKAIAELLESC
jgi:lipid-A-disaccharide synthase